MADPRYKKLAEVLTGYSTQLKKGDTVLFDVTDTPNAFAIELVRAARKRGATPLLETRNSLSSAKCSWARMRHTQRRSVMSR